jgi:flagellar biosynthesis chaperone FliJ
MTIRPRAVRALRDARERLRDAAAATHAQSTAARELSAADLAVEERRLSEHMDEAPTLLSTARTVHELDRVAETTGVYRIAIADASTRLQSATALTDQTAGKLRERTRQLRSAERLVEIVDDSRAKLEARNEQRANDDLASRRR